jgi:hypothetical protein
MLMELEWAKHAPEYPLHRTGWVIKGECLYPVKRQLVALGRSRGRGNEAGRPGVGSMRGTT